MITVNMFNDLNSMIQEEAPFLRITAVRSNITGKEWTYYNVGLPQSKYVNTENHPLNVTEELKNDIESFLGNKGIKNIVWNNFYTTFWETE